jgi:hypothetical protein
VRPDRANQLAAIAVDDFGVGAVAEDDFGVAAPG